MHQRERGIGGVVQINSPVTGGAGNIADGQRAGTIDAQNAVVGDGAAGTRETARVQRGIAIRRRPDGVGVGRHGRIASINGQIAGQRAGVVEVGRAVGGGNANFDSVGNRTTGVDGHSATGVDFNRRSQTAGHHQRAAIHRGQAGVGVGGIDLNGARATHREFARVTGTDEGRVIGQGAGLHNFDELIAGTGAHITAAIDRDISSISQNAAASQRVCAERQPAAVIPKAEGAGGQTGSQIGNTATGDLVINRGIVATGSGNNGHIGTKIGHIATTDCRPIIEAVVSRPRSQNAVVDRRRRANGAAAGVSVGGKIKQPGVACDRAEGQGQAGTIGRIERNLVAPLVERQTLNGLSIGAGLVGEHQVAAAAQSQTTGGAIQDVVGRSRSLAEV